MGSTKTNLLLLLFCLFFTGLNAQFDQALGQWKSYLPYSKGTSVTQNATDVFFATDFSLLQINKEDDAIRRFSKVEGLSDVGVGLIKHSPYSETLIITYTNGNLDIKSPEGFTNLPFIKNEDIKGDRNIYDIYFAAKEQAFIATGFGILELNPITGTFKNDIRTGIAVRNIIVHDGIIYAATEEGIYTAMNDPAINLQDFGTNWSLLGAEDGFPLDYSASAMASYQNKLFLSINDTIFTYKNDSLNYFFSDSLRFVQYLSAEGPSMLIGMNCSNCQSKIYKFDWKGVLSEVSQSCVGIVQYAVEDLSNRIWFADLYEPFKIKADPNNNWCDPIVFGGPYSGNTWDIEVFENQLWVASGGVNAQFNKLTRRDGVFSYINNEWNAYNTFNDWDIFKGEDGIHFNGDDMTDFVSVKMHPSGDKIYFGSYTQGLIEYDLVENQMKLFNEKNSSIEIVQADPGRSSVSDLDFDPNGNLWLVNFQADNPISTYNPTDGTWKNFNLSRCGNPTKLYKIVVDRQGNKWISADDTGIGLLVFNEGDINDPSDDQCRNITSNNSELPSNRVNSIVMDLDGDIWVGTENGAVVFECGSQVFDESLCRGDKRIVNIGGDDEHLLKGENVQAITVDGANRKWFGTSNGIFIQAPDGDEELGAFNVSNSPLFDNSINALGVNNKTGEVFIGTGSGLQSYRSDATEGGVINSEVTVFPNPVRPEYEGQIAIGGLARDANVKITNIEGRLVYETEALGGQAVWDGKDYNGRKVATGVYLIFSTTSRSLDEPQAVVGKLLFIN